MTNKSIWVPIKLLDSASRKWIQIPMLVDTGSSFTLLPKKYFSSAENPTRLVGTRTASAENELRYEFIKTLSIQTRDDRSVILEKFPIVRTDLEMGILGMDLLAKFSYVIKNGQLYLLKVKAI